MSPGLSEPPSRGGPQTPWKSRHAAWPPVSRLAAAPSPPSPAPPRHDGPGRERPLTAPAPQIHAQASLPFHRGATCSPAAQGTPPAPPLLPSLTPHRQLSAQLTAARPSPLASPPCRLLVICFPEVKFTRHKTRHFKEQHLGAFGACAGWCNHHPSLVPERSTTPKGDPGPSSGHSLLQTELCPPHSCVEAPTPKATITGNGPFWGGIKAN